ncbi:hypothetical protein [Paracidovorax avenae]|uniref:hypothetical protein n=1 Tax=Paracidovorax avenae TaxID=80867 RepID=UPI001864CEFE|nr:hypothetical protein [Paracidovorax avenae]
MLIAIAGLHHIIRIGGSLALPHANLFALKRRRKAAWFLLLQGLKPSSIPEDALMTKQITNNTENYFRTVQL